MLVLSRQRDETIMIGDDIEITIVDIRGDKVRLGITAPTRIAVHRKEVYDAIKAENQRASSLGNGDLMAIRPAATAQQRALRPHALSATGTTGAPLPSTPLPTTGPRAPGGFAPNPAAPSPTTPRPPARLGPTRISP